jgi:phosphoribosylformimino-5-aminoimidazole carboxamide ribotide isomerase
MRILPVIDLLKGQVVRGVAGRRSEYRPIVSRLTDSSLPLDVARAFRAHFGLSELYLADLDAISGQAPALATYAGLHSEEFRLWVDAGVRGAGEVAPLADAGIASIVLGLETIAGPSALEAIVRQFRVDRLVFSVDLHEGRSLGNRSAWPSDDPWAIASLVIEMGIRRLIVLDLARVGVHQGTGTEAFCERLISTYPHVEVTAGGGVRDITDLRRLKEQGVQGVLVASALHDGRISREQIQDLLKND